MDEPSHSLPLDTSLTRLESSVPISDSSCVRHPRRSSCEYEYKGPVGQFIMDPQGHSSVYSYTTTSWSEMFGSSTARDVYGQSTRYDPKFGPQVMSNRSRLGNKTSQSLDLDCSLTQSVMLPRRQSLDETFHQTASSKNPGPFRGYNGSFQRSTQSCVADQTLVHKEHASRSATYGSRGNSQETFGLSTCMFPETQTSAPHPNTEPLKHQSRQKLHHHRHLTTGGEFTRTYPYPYLDIKTEPVDPPGTSQSQYSEQSGRVEPLVNLPEGFYNSTYGSDNTYDALYKQASRSEGDQMYGFQKGRKSKTRHPLLPSTSKEDSEDTTNIFSASASDRALLIGSNKGASKQRRDQINNEIGTMRDLLPLPESSRQRLSQLQIMSLSCVFIRKCNILQKLFNATPGGSSDSPCDFSQSLTGFLLVTTRDGKLVYISENVTEYLGHSMVDMKTQGDSLFDIVDKRDHGTVRAQLLHGAGEVDPDKEVAFFCRMNMSRTLKRQAGFGDVKVMHVKGHFATVPGQDPGTEQQVFMAVCSPLITPDIKESLIQNNTMVFKSVHQLDMNFIELTENGEYHLGVSNDEVCNKSWYSYLHPEDIYEAREKHVQLIKSRHEMGCMMTVRMITSTNEIIWVNIVMHVRQALLSNSDDPVILCINQVISEKEAYQFKVQGQLFALYAARSPDFFFGTAFCAPITPAMENVMSPPSGILPSPFFSRQQPFDNTLPAQTPPFMQNAVPPNQTAMFMKNGYQPNIGRQGHTDTLKALKRKIQENYTCKPPMKVPRMVNGITNRNTYSPPQDTTPLPSSFESNIYRNSFGPLVGGGDHHRGMGQGPMQVMYAHNLPTVMMSPKEKSYMPDVFPHKPMYEEKCLEQVVPDVTVPACYLTPEPSPVSSPEPPKKCESVHTVKDGKLIDPVLIAKHLCALKQKQLNPNSNMNPNGEPRKLLPSLDAFYVDSFFNEIDNVSLTREEEIRLLENVAKEKVTIKEEPIDQDTCKETTEPLTNGFDIEEFLQFTEKSKDEVVQVKVESRTDDQQVMSFENSPSPSSPYSTISAADEKFSSDDLSSFALTPESGFESDSLDDVLDPDCWDLESVKMDMSMTSTQPTLPAFRMTQDLHPEPELYQLKQLISSCTPSGMQDFTEDSQ